MQQEKKMKFDNYSGHSSNYRNDVGARQGLSKKTTVKINKSLCYQINKTLFENDNKYKKGNQSDFVISATK